MGTRFGEHEAKNESDSDTNSSQIAAVITTSMITLVVPDDEGILLQQTILRVCELKHSVEHV